MIRQQVRPVVMGWKLRAELTERTTFEIRLSDLSHNITNAGHGADGEDTVEFKLPHP
jgi:hypothetical protein